MSHLVRAIVREELSAVHLETLLDRFITEDAVESPSHHHDEWEHLWTDVGGEG